MVNFNLIKEYCTNNNACKLKNVVVSSPAFQEIKRLELNKDVFCRSGAGKKHLLQRIRDTYIQKNPDAFMTLDHVKSNYDNLRIIKSVENQTNALQAVSTEDFCNLSQIMKNFRLPFSVNVHRAMDADNFNIGRITPEKFFREYYQEGKEVIMPIYMSTSFDKNIAYRFANDNPNRFIINLKVDRDVPAVYMENLCPGDGVAYGYEQELNIIRNAKLVFEKLKQTINPWNNKKIYELDARVTGFVDTVPKPQPVFEMSKEDMELVAAIKDNFLNKHF